MMWRFFSLATAATASATPEFDRSVIMSTPPASNHSRAFAAPTSALFVWSAKITSIGLPSCLPPKSSTAIFTASTAPLPDESA